MDINITCLRAEIQGILPNEIDKQCEIVGEDGYVTLLVGEGLTNDGEPVHFELKFPCPVAIASDDEFDMLDNPTGDMNMDWVERIWEMFPYTKPGYQPPES